MVRFSSGYMTTDDRDLKKKQIRFPKKTQQIYIQREEVKTSDGYALVEPLIDPNEPPHELHLIKKVTSLVGEPWWVKKAMKKLGFEYTIPKQWRVVYSIQPNTKEINDLLHLCKHVVKILPVKFKNGYPTAADLNNTRIDLETGEFEIVKQLETITINDTLTSFKLNDVNVTTDLRTDSSFPLDKKEILRSVHRQRELCLLNDEYFPAKYDYKYGQDMPGVIRVKGRPDTSVKEDEITE